MSRPRFLFAACALFAVLCGGVGAARAEATPPAGVCDDPSKSGKTDRDGREACDKPTIEVSLAFQSAYVFRGDNVFQEEHQDDQNWVAKPRFIITDGSDKFSIGYAGAYQVTGDNISENIDKGVGSEQILFADYDFTLAPSLVLSPEAGMYFYPAAPAAPLLLEASTEFWYLGPIELGVFAGYLGAVRPGPVTESYFYFSPRIVKSFPLGSRFEFGMQLNAGVKLRTSGDATDNTVDVLAAEYLRYSMTDVFFVTLNWALAWTNLGTRVDPDTKETVVPNFGDECAPFWGLTVGADL